MTCVGEGLGGVKEGEDVRLEDADATIAEDAENKRKSADERSEERVRTD